MFYCWLKSTFSVAFFFALAISFGFVVCLSTVLTHNVILPRHLRKFLFRSCLRPNLSTDFSRMLSNQCLVLTFLSDLFEDSTVQTLDDLQPN